MLVGRWAAAGDAYGLGWGSVEDVQVWVVWVNPPVITAQVTPADSRGR